MRIYPTIKQKQILDEYIDTSRYVYNKCVYEIEINKEKINTFYLRDKLVTYKTKKVCSFYKEYEDKINKLKEKKKEETSEVLKEEYTKQIKQVQQELRDECKKIKYTVNSDILDFELNTPKNIRFNAIKQCVDAYKTCFSNLRNGNIKYFKIKNKEKKDKKQSFTIDKCDIKYTKDGFEIYPGILKEDKLFKFSKRIKKKKNIEISGQVDIIKFKNIYTLCIPISTTIYNTEKTNNIISVDPGIRTLATCHKNNILTGETSIVEYIHRKDLINKLNKKIDRLKIIKQLYRLKQYSKKTNKHVKKKKVKIKKRVFNKLEKKKENIINEIHWSFINHILKENDIIYFGDIKSHNVVKRNKNRYLNRDTNDLKFYILKQRLIYKSSLYNSKTVIMVNECYTSKTCSSCGIINPKLGASKVFNCINKRCNLSIDRDMNASKNIKLKGMLS